MEKGMVFQVQKFCTDDGPGIRTTVFFKGCPLRCVWCHNPEGLSTARIIAIDDIRCIKCGACASVCHCHAVDVAAGAHVFRAEDCTVCGRCVTACKADAISFCGEETTVEPIIKSVLADKMFYKASGGGITLSGGEPLLQPAFAAALLQRAKEENLHTCVETSLGVPFQNIEKVAPYVDLFLCDIKETNSENHQKYVGCSLDFILDNLKQLNRLGIPIQLRCPIIPSVNDNAAHFKAIATLHNELLQVIGVQLMPYHMLGQGKAERYGLQLAQQAFCPPTAETVKSWNETLQRMLIKKDNIK